jgi:hypothetical protein
LAEALAMLAGTVDLVSVELGATSVTAPVQLAAALRGPALLLSDPGRCLLLVDPPRQLVAELDRAGVQAARVGRGAEPVTRTVA